MDQVENTLIRFVSRGVGKWGKWDKRRKWKSQFMCVTLGLALGVVAHLMAGMEQDLAQGYILKRNSYGQGDTPYQLLVRGLEADEVALDLNLSERTYTREEAHRVYEAIMEQLPGYILADNGSLKDVRSNLDLITSLNQYGVRLRWESDSPELVNSFGEVNNESLDDEGSQVCLRVRMTEGRWPEEYAVSIEVKPPLLTEQEQVRKAFLNLLYDEDERQNTQETMKLPDSFQGRSLSYSSRKESSFFSMTGLGAAAACMFSLKEKRDIKKKEEVRKQQMTLDYPEILSRLIIFLGAGMSIRTAWDKIAFEYQDMVASGRRTPRHVYREMYETSCQIRSGVSEWKAFVEFGGRCGLQSYIKLSGLLEQNRKNGSKNLRDTLKLEMAEAFEQRKHQARRLGEEAGTRLLLPLFMLLSVVMIMIAVPALMEFG